MSSHRQTYSDIEPLSYTSMVLAPLRQGITTEVGNGGGVH